jgi:hypothetical protein
MIPAPKIKLASFQRIKAAGCEIEVKQRPKTYLVHLLKGERIVASGEAPRNASINVVEALVKARNGRWGPTSGMGQLLEGFADIAEALNKNV